MIDYIIIAVITLLVGFAVFYIFRQKKKGIKCIGCPDAKTCGGKCSGCSENCSCH